MRIISCHIENFGRLSDITFDFDENLNIRLEENGWGKTTLCAFIRAMFYGLGGSRKKDYLENERSRYQPWNGGMFGGELTYEVAGRRYIIIRDFAKKDKDATFRLLDERTRLESSDYSESVGEELFGVDRDAFLRTAFISHTDVKYNGVTSGVGAKVGSLSQKGDLENYDKVEKRLHDYLNEKSSRRKTGELYKLNQSIAEAEASISSAGDLDARRAETSRNRDKEEERVITLESRLESIRRYKELTAGVRSIEDSLRLTPQIDRSRYDILSDLFQGGIPEDEEIDSKINIYNDIQNLIQKNDTLEAMIDTMKDEQSETHSRRNGKVLIAATAIIILAGIIIGTIIHNLIISGIIGVVALGALLFLLPGKSGKAHDTSAVERYRQNIRANEDDIRRLEADLKEYLGRLGQTYSRVDAEGLLYDIKAKSKEYRELTKDIKIYEKQTEELRDRLDSSRRELQAYLSQHPELESDQNADASAISNEISEARNLVMRYNGELEGIAERQDELAEMRAALEDMKARRAELQHRVEVMKRTGEYMKQAKESFVSRFMSPVKNAFDKYMEILSRTGDYAAGEYVIDANMDISRKEEGAYHGIAAQSDGYGDMIGLAIRLALLDVMYKEEKPVIIMDDPFSNMDTDRVRYGKRFLEEISGEYQIIYFTCHDSRA